MQNWFEPVFVESLDLKMDRVLDLEMSSQLE
jgi:hypothetical protein